MIYIYIGLWLIVGNIIIRFAEYNLNRDKRDTIDNSIATFFGVILLNIVWPIVLIILLIDNFNNKKNINKIDSFFKTVIRIVWGVR